MHSVVVQRVIATRLVPTRRGPSYRADLEIVGGGRQSFSLSVKQGRRLLECAAALGRAGGFSSKHGELHAVLDGEQFVWCGIHSARRSDLAEMGERFGVAFTPVYVSDPAAGDEPVSDAA